MDVSKPVSISLEIVMAVFTILTYFKIDPISLPQEVQIFFKVPWQIYAFFFVIILIIIFIMRKEKPQFRPFAAAILRESLIGGVITFNDVNWDVRVPVPSHFEDPNEYDRRLPNLLQIDTPPKCPKCKVELSEEKNLFFGYTWNCIGCGFSKRSRDTFCNVSENVKKIVKRDCDNGDFCYSKIFSNQGLR